MQLTSFAGVKLESCTDEKQKEKIKKKIYKNKSFERCKEEYLDFVLAYNLFHYFESFSNFSNRPFQKVQLLYICCNFAIYGLMYFVVNLSLVCMYNLDLYIVFKISIWTPSGIRLVIWKLGFFLPNHNENYMQTLQHYANMQLF